MHFSLVNHYRCNDVLELVETTRHFRLLADAAEIGGAGSMSLDALVKEIHVKYTQAMKDFFAVVDNVLSIDGTQNFERAFFRFRTVVKVCNCILNYNPIKFLNTCIVLGKKLSVYLLFPVHGYKTEALFYHVPLMVTDISSDIQKTEYKFSALHQEGKHFSWSL